MGLLLAIGFLVWGHSGRYTLVPYSLFAGLGLLFAGVHGLSLVNRPRGHDPTFHPLWGVSYVETLWVDMVMVLLLGLALYTGLCVFNASFDVSPSVPAKVTIVALHPKRTLRTSNTVLVSHPALGSRTLALTVGKDVLDQLQVGQCLSVLMHAGYFQWLWVDPPMLFVAQRCDTLDP
jgi:hypothetical protein